MNIEDIKINEYGVIKNKEIKLKKGINIIHGNNESGKSTLLSYINNSLYGISKNKENKNISDYDKYKPWNSDEFSGRISYSLDNGEKFEVFRDFNKKNPKIYNQNLEDISQNFDVDKKEGNKFFVEQTGVSKQMYLSTVVSMQQEVRLEEKEQNALIQKIANIAGTGEDNVSYKKALEKLQNKIRDEIGTSNTKQKPINNINNELNKINEEINKIAPYKNRKYEIETEKEEVQNEILQAESNKKVLDEIKTIFDEQSEKKQKAKINVEEVQANRTKLANLYNENDGYEIKTRNIEQEIERIEKTKSNLIKEQDALKGKLEQNNTEEPKKEKVKAVPYILISILFVLFAVVGIAVLKNIIVLACAIIFVVIPIIMYLVKKKKINNRYYLEQKRVEQDKNKYLENLQEDIQKIENEINRLNEQIKERTTIKNEEISKMSMLKGQIILLENKNNELEEEQNKINNTISNEFENRKNEILSKYETGNEYKYINNINEVNQKLAEVIDEINNKKVELNAIQLEEKTIIPHVENLVELEEKKDAYQNEFSELIKKANIIKIAISALEDADTEMKKNITPKFTQSLSSAISKISSDKYTKVTINDENGIVVENSRGEYINANNLSCGTIDQLYLALRLSMIDDLSNEKMPIMLDETFAYFDDQRMEEVIKYLSENLNNHQAIIFTCSNREKQILNKLNIEYNNVEL